MLARLGSSGLHRALPASRHIVAAQRLVWQQFQKQICLAAWSPGSQRTASGHTGLLGWRRPASNMSDVAAAAAAAGVDSGSDLAVVYVTVPSRDVGQKLGRALVERQLAACVNIVPGLLSIYSWDGKVNEDPEELCIIKTRRALLPRLTAAVKELHPYDEPEVLGLPVAGGSATYIDWVRQGTRAGSGGAGGT